MLYNKAAPIKFYYYSDLKFLLCLLFLAFFAISIKQLFTLSQCDKGFIGWSQKKIILYSFLWQTQWLLCRTDSVWWTYFNKIAINSKKEEIIKKINHCSKKNKIGVPIVVCDITGQGSPIGMVADPPPVKIHK